MIVLGVAISLAATVATVGGHVLPEAKVVFVEFESEVSGTGSQQRCLGGGTRMMLFPPHLCVI